ncbi:hypothetical protein H632_c3383p0, partial [Helicosporidium sp. ATCC 50920]
YTIYVLRREARKAKADADCRDPAARRESAASRSWVHKHSWPLADPTPRDTTKRASAATVLLHATCNTPASVFPTYSPFDPNFPAYGATLSPNAATQPSFDTLHVRERSGDVGATRVRYVSNAADLGPFAELASASLAETEEDVKFAAVSPFDADFPSTPERAVDDHAFDPCPVFYSTDESDSEYDSEAWEAFSFAGSEDDSEEWQPLFLPNYDSGYLADVDSFASSAALTARNSSAAVQPAISSGINFAEATFETVSPFDTAFPSYTEATFETVSPFNAAFPGYTEDIFETVSPFDAAFPGYTATTYETVSPFDAAFPGYTEATFETVSPFNAAFPGYTATTFETVS